MKTLLLTTLASFVVLSSSAVAQDWNYSASLYLFTAETQTDIGDTSATLSFSDAIDNLDVAFMGSLEGNNGQWGFLVDYMLTDLTFDNTAVSVDASVKTQILTGYLTYQLYNKDAVRTDLLFGARWFDTSTVLSSTSIAPTLDVSDSWVDPVIGVRSKFALSENWSGTFVADYGGARDRETWQVLLTADYAINDNWVARFGYRHIDVSNNGIANGYEFRQSGPIIGATFQF